MQLSRFLFLVAFALLPVCLVSTTWLYLYPLFHKCAFPVPDSPTSTPSPHAPFRLLALGDPQLEGVRRGAPAFPSLQFLHTDLPNAGSWERGWDILRSSLSDAVKKDLPKWLEGHRKRFDLWGNDLYLAHIVRQLRWWTEPTHVAVLGDLLGSQWIKNDEFERRVGRYWGTVFQGMEKVPDAIMTGDEEEGNKRWGGRTELLGEDKSWENRVINIAGNHDIGYAGDLDENRIERFEKAFGKVNWDIVFELPRTNLSSQTEDERGNEEPEMPALRLVTLNSMNLDTPALSESLQRETYDFMNRIIMTSRSVNDKTHATVLLTHIPLHKKSGICVDDPFFAFFDTGSGVKEQNMLSPHSSKTILESIFGLSSNRYAEGQGFGRRGIIINGHDHEGCDVLHYISKTEHACPPILLPHDMPEDFYASYLNTTETPEWHALRVPATSSSPLHPHKFTELGECIAYKEVPSIREITLRSMMGDFSGYAGFLSAWFDDSLGEKGEWRLEFATCGIGVQHWWWAVHITDIIAVALLVNAILARVAECMILKKRGIGHEKPGNGNEKRVGKAMAKEKNTGDKGAGEAEGKKR